MTITLALVTTIGHELAQFSLNKSLSTIKFDDVLVFSDRKIDITHPYRYVKIPETLDRTGYSVFCLKQMYQYIETDHVLITQPDGMAVNSQFWDDQFLEYDYVGPPYNLNEKHTNEGLVEHFGFPQYKNVNKWIVGNGGFSLRSKKLLKALQDDKITEYVFNEKTKKFFYGEDLQITVIHRDILEKEYGIKYAPIEVALRFATERLVDNGMSFGFHGWQNIPWFLDEDECMFYINQFRPNWDEYRLNRLMGFLYEKNYYRAMMKVNELRTEWDKL